MLAAGDTIEQRVVQRVMKGDKVKDQDWDRTGKVTIIRNTERVSRGSFYQPRPSRLTKAEG